VVVVWSWGEVEQMDIEVYEVAEERDSCGIRALVVGSRGPSGVDSGAGRGCRRSGVEVMAIGDLGAVRFE
jgi:hypothetical protein